MKLIFVCLLPLVLNLVSIASENTLTVKITNIKTSEGEIAVALYNAEKKFMKSSYKTKTGKAVAGTVEIIFENIPQGQYALSVMHDENKNLKLDTNLLGIPKEGFGFSNNAMGNFGPPSFEKAKIEITGSKEISIKLKYL